MKWMILPGIWLTLVCISGCVKNLPPHEEVNQAVKKSFDATGFNYQSKSRITKLALAKTAAIPATTDKNAKYVSAALDIVRGFSVNVDGALDLQRKKSEALYDLHYNRDNVEVSVRLPLLVDYHAQTIYIGPSLLTTALNIVLPREEAKNQLIRLHIPELLQIAAAGSPELAKLVGDDRFSAKNMDLINDVFKTTIIKAVARMDDARFSEQPLTEQDRKSGITRRIQLKLDKGETVAILLELVDSIAQTLFQEGLVGKSEYAVLLMLTDRQKLDPLLEKIDLTMTQDVGVGHDGYVSDLVSRLSVADQEGTMQVGLENVSTFDRYNAPRFTMTPETSQIIDFKEILDAILAITPAAQAAPAPEVIPPGDADGAVDPDQEALGRT